MQMGEIDESHCVAFGVSSSDGLSDEAKVPFSSRFAPCFSPVILSQARWLRDESPGECFCCTGF